MSVVERLTQIHDKMKVMRDDPALEKDLVELMLTLKTVPASPVDIKTSQIHLTMNDLKKSPQAPVSAAAKEVILFWKSATNASATTTTPQDPEKKVQLSPLPVSTNASTTPTATTTPTTTTPTSEPIAPSSQFKRKNIQPEFLMGRTSSTTRDQIQKIFLQALEPKNVEEAVLFELAVTIEAELFKHFKGEGPEYKSRARVIYTNLKDPKNPDFSDAVIDGMILPSELPTLDDKSMASKEAQKRMDELKNYEMAKRTTDDGCGDGKGVDTFVCPQCKKKNCSYYQKQTRSADEPMTIFCHCLECGKRFRIYP